LRWMACRAQRRQRGGPGPLPMRFRAVPS
jgi:hypothetical protein